MKDVWCEKRVSYYEANFQTQRNCCTDFDILRWGLRRGWKVRFRIMGGNVAAQCPERLRMLYVMWYSPSSESTMAQMVAPGTVPGRREVARGECG